MSTAIIPLTETERELVARIHEQADALDKARTALTLAQAARLSPSTRKAVDEALTAIGRTRLRPGVKPC